MTNLHGDRGASRCRTGPNDPTKAPVGYVDQGISGASGYACSGSTRRRGDLRAAPDAEVSEERSYATEKKWSARQSIISVFVMSVVLWALIILGVRQIF